MPIAYPAPHSQSVMADFPHVFEHIASPLSGHFRSPEPRCDIIETKETTYIKLSLPGLTRTDIQLHLHPTSLTISGSHRRHAELDLPEAQFSVNECPTGPFSRSFRVPNGVRKEGIKARCAEGVLTVEVPKGGTEEVERIEVS